MALPTHSIKTFDMTRPVNFDYEGIQMGVNQMPLPAGLQGHDSSPNNVISQFRLN